MLIDVKTCLNDKELKVICKCLRDAITDTKVMLNDYYTENSWAILYWDNVNKRFVESCVNNTGLENCEVFITKRGPWAFAIMYKDGIIYTFMREERFEELKKTYEANSKTMHYTVGLSKILNIGLPKQQQILFSDNVDNTQVKDMVTKILKQLLEKNKVIEGYVTILFDAGRTELYGARMVLLNGCLEICAEYDLGKYIHFEESVIVESVNDYPNNTPDDPTKGLKLTKKWLDRKAKKEKRDIKYPNKDSDSHDTNDSE